MQIIEKQTRNKGVVFQYKESFMDNGRRVVVSVTLDAKTKAAQKRAGIMLWEKYQNRGKKKNPVAQKDVTVSEACRTWEDSVKQRIKVQTHINHEIYIKKLLSGLPDGFRLADFTPDLAEKIVNHMYYQEKLSHGYVYQILAIIRNVMKFAASQGFPVDAGKFSGIRLQKRAATRAEIEKRSGKFLDSSELKECLRQLREINERIAYACEFQSLTGLRVGEMLALRQQDIHLDAKTIDINGTITRHSGQGFFRDTPKNIYSVRTIAINRRCAEIVQWFMTDNKRLDAWTKTYQEQGYIFTSIHGLPIESQVFNSALKRVHINGKTLSTHIFRHTHISMLASMNIPLRAIMQRVGQNNPNTTMQIYTHVTESMQKELSEKLDRLAI